MALGPALLAAVPGLIQGIGGLFGQGRRKREQRRAQGRFDTDLAARRSFRHRNPYANLENTAEDLTINQQADTFQAQETDRVLANALDTIQQTGGGGGDAQYIADAALQASGGRSANTARQEARNQQIAAQQAANLQQLEAIGDERVQGLRYGQLGDNLAISGDRLGAANAAVQQGNQAIISGFTSAATKLLGGIGQGGASDAVSSPTAVDASGNVVDATQFYTPQTGTEARDVYNEYYN